MEKKTLGSFIAALRKSKGLTQRELADQLHVSDKSVSRWERDEGTPDLSLIPVIAEIFDVTADELLRGERRPSGEQNHVSSPKGEKQRRHLLQVGLTRYRNQSLLSAALLGCGLIAGMVANFAFLRAAVGFYAGAAFFLVAAVLQCVWVNGAMLTVSDEEMVREEATPYRRQVIKLAEIVWMGVLVLTAALVPLMIYPDDPAHSGMTASYFEEYALVYGAIGLLIGAVILWLVNGSLVKRGILVPEDKKRHFRNRTRLKRCVAGLAVAVAVTFLAETVVLKGWNVTKLAEYTEFHDCKSFVAFMERRIPSKPWRGDQTAPNMEIGAEAPQRVPDVGLENVDELPQYYDEYGNPISEEEALREELLDKDGNVLCTYLHRNESVVHWEIGQDKNGDLVIRTVDWNQLMAAHEKGNKIVFVFGVLYAVEAAGAALFYLLRREKGKSWCL